MRGLDLFAKKEIKPEICIIFIVHCYINTANVINNFTNQNRLSLFLRLLKSF
jgi:hypothetical protein